MRKKVKDVTTTGTSSALAVPDYMGKKAGRGLQNITKEDQVIPKLILVQPMSPEHTQKGVPEGVIYNKLTGKNLGKEVIVIPIIQTKGRVCFQSRDLGGGVLCASDDNLKPRSMSEAIKAISLLKRTATKATGKGKGKSAPDTTEMEDCSTCPLKDWNDDGKTTKERAPKCSQFVNFAVLIQGESMPVSITMDRSKMRIAKKWMSMMVQAGDNLDVFSRKYKLLVQSETRENKTFYNFDVESVGFTTATEYNKAEGLYESFKNIRAVAPEEQ